MIMLILSQTIEHVQAMVCQLDDAKSWADKQTQLKKNRSKSRADFTFMN
jgi:hypothetical protein